MEKIIQILQTRNVGGQRHDHRSRTRDYDVDSPQLLPKQSTRDFESAITCTPDLEFSNMELAAYEGLRLSIRYKLANGSGGSGRASKTGGITVRGSIRNTSENELFLLAGSRTRTPPGNPNWYRAQLQIKNSTYSKNYKQISRYIIEPGEKLTFEIVAAKQEIDDVDDFELEIEWPVMEFDSLSERLVKPVFAFSRKGSSLVWGEGTIYWDYPIPVYRAEWARSP